MKQLLLFLITLPLHGTLKIDGDRFRYNDQVIDLYGIRCASAAGKEEYTESLIKQLDDYKAHGVNSVTVFYQGSSGGHYDPFTPGGKNWQHPEIRDRMDRLIEACAERDMIFIAGIFYQWKNTKLTERSLTDWTATKEAVSTVANHLKAKSYDNVILNIANEQNSGGYADEPWGRVRNVPDLLDLSSALPRKSTRDSSWDAAATITTRTCNSDSPRMLMFSSSTRSDRIDKNHPASTTTTSSKTA